MPAPSPRASRRSARPSIAGAEPDAFPFLTTLMDFFATQTHVPEWRDLVLDHYNVQADGSTTFRALGGRRASRHCMLRAKRCHGDAEHKSNTIYFQIDRAARTLVQKCWDAECQTTFRGTGHLVLPLLSFPPLAALCDPLLFLLPKDSTIDERARAEWAPLARRAVEQFPSLALRFHELRDLAAYKALLHELWIAWNAVGGVLRLRPGLHVPIQLNPTHARFGGKRRAPPSGAAPRRTAQAPSSVPVPVEAEAEAEAEAEFESS